MRGSRQNWIWFQMPRPTLHCHQRAYERKELTLEHLLASHWGVGAPSYLLSSFVSRQQWFTAWTQSPKQPATKYWSVRSFFFLSCLIASLIIQIWIRQNHFQNQSWQKRQIVSIRIPTVQVLVVQMFMQKNPTSPSLFTMSSYNVLVYEGSQEPPPPGLVERAV